MVSRRTEKRRRARGRLPRCGTCQQPFRWLAWGRSWRKFEPHPVDGRPHDGPPAYPVETKRAWRIRELVEDLMVRRQVGHDEAEDEVYAMPWFVPHVCPPTADRDHPTITKENRP